MDGGEKTLATLGWPNTVDEATSMKRYPLTYHQCLTCRHIWNTQFNYEHIPYELNPNRMFNAGKTWSQYLSRMQKRLIKVLPKNPTVIDVGSGDGHFIRQISKMLEHKGRFIGFDPNSSERNSLGLEFFAEYFDPVKDIIKYQPDLVIMRHVLEHLETPATFVEQLCLGASKVKKKVYYFAETPCVDQALKANRVVDFFYEHPSQFTKMSFKRLMELGGSVREINLGYRREVVSGLVELGLSKEQKQSHIKANAFLKSCSAKIKLIHNTCKKFKEDGHTIAVWGGTGKAATFIQHYGLLKSLCPIVVDSDVDKVGFFVPGTGQKIEHSSYLADKYTDVILIPSQWRAADIVSEINTLEISYGRILIEHGGNLIDFFSAEHPYK